MELNGATDVDARLVDDERCRLRWRIGGEHVEHGCNGARAHRRHVCPDCGAALQLDEGCE